MEDLQSLGITPEGKSSAVSSMINSPLFFSLAKYVKFVGSKSFWLVVGGVAFGLLIVVILTIILCCIRKKN